MPRGGKRENAGRKKNVAETPTEAPSKREATEMIASLAVPDDQWKKKHPNWAKDQPCQCWKCLWRGWIRKDCSSAQYVWNRRDGKPAQAVIVADNRESSRELDFGDLPMPAGQPGEAGKPN